MPPEGINWLKIDPPLRPSARPMLLIDSPALYRRHISTRSAADHPFPFDMTAPPHKNCKVLHRPIESTRFGSSQNAETSTFFNETFSSAQQIAPERSRAAVSITGLPTNFAFAGVQQL